MAKYGLHRRTRPILAEISAEDPALPGVALRVGLREAEARDAIQNAYLRVFWQDITPPSIARVPASELHRIIRALLMVHVRWAARDLLRKRVRENGRTEGQESADLLEDATRDLVIAVIDLGGCAQTDDEVLSRQRGPFEAFADQLFDLAGLDDEERRLAQYLRDEPGNRNQDFDPRLRPDQVSRLKKRMMEKILRLLYTGTRSKQEGARR